MAVGLAAGAVVYFAANRMIVRGGRTPTSPTLSPAGPPVDGGSALALGAFLDGTPEQMVLGIGLAAGNGVSIGLVTAIFVSNLPEAIGSANEMKAAGRSAPTIARLWIGVAGICVLATIAGYGLADVTSGDVQATINGFAAGALLVMLIDSMIPDAVRKAGDFAGLVTVLGFAVAAGLSRVS